MRKLSKMKRYSMIFMLSLLGCSGEALVEKYKITWESDLAATLYDPNSVFRPLYYFSSLLEVDDGYVAVGLRGIPTDVILIKTDREGNKVRDVSFSSLSFQNFYKSGDRLILVAGLGSGNFKIVQFSNDLTELKTTELSLNIESFARYFFLGDFLYVFNTSNETLRKVDFDNKEYWIKTSSQLGLKSSFVSFFPKSPDEFTILHADLDNVVFTQVDASNGSITWKRELNIEKELDMDMHYPSIKWASGKLHLAGIDLSQPEKIAITTINRFGIVSSRSHVDRPSAYFSQLLPTDDGGHILVFSSWNGVATNFQLLKTDSKGNAGWSGNFSYLSEQTLGDIIKSSGGSIIILANRGYLTKISPQY